ncbi:MAG TPA: diacylglycerol kinase family protein [Polyangiaceae bacterium]|jgi:YegS/Rv2252/BmrU family lipid kinase|nr:diacylglycerol kinase family protein [Polyangiaceae bacterium]
MKIRVIVNPKAGAGSAGSKVPELTRAFERRGRQSEIVQTRAAGDAVRLAREARADGVELLVVVGGDGTVNEVSRAYVDESGAPLEGPHLGVVPAGTGGDFRKSFDISKDVDAAVSRMLDSAPRPLDLGILEVCGDDGGPVVTTFVNIASFGISGRIDRLVNESPKWMGGRLAFFVGTLRAMSTYRNAPVSVRVDGKPWFEGRMQVVAIANGRFFGGGMHIAPEADPGDGVFDVVVMGDIPFAESLRLAPAVYKGEHLSEPRVLSTRGSLVEAEPLAPAPVYVDSDGETPGRLPLKARIARGALRIRA